MSLKEMLNVLPLRGHQYLALLFCQALRSVSAQHKEGASCGVNVKRFGTGSKWSSDLGTLLSH